MGLIPFNLPSRWCTDISNERLGTWGKKHGSKKLFVKINQYANMQETVMGGSGNHVSPQINTLNKDWEIKPINNERLFHVLFSFGVANNVIHVCKAWRWLSKSQLKACLQQELVRQFPGLRSWASCKQVHFVLTDNFFNLWNSSV